MDKIIEHFMAMQKQAEERLGTTEDPREELSDWHMGLYSGERRAYGHCIKFLQQKKETKICMCNQRIVFEDETDKTRLCFNHAVSAVFLGHKIEAQLVDMDDALGRVCEAGGHE